MFARKRSRHGRLMGAVRSAQQKCIRRGLEEPLIALNLEHLLSTPDMSRAAITRMQVVAAEDVGVGALGLLPALQELERGWRGFDANERAKRLIQASRLCVESQRSRFVPCWAIDLLTAVPKPNETESFESFEGLLERLEECLDGRDLRACGICIEEIFLRHPMGKEAPLPEEVELPKAAMAQVWERLKLHCPSHLESCFASWRRAFGPPSREGMASRLFAYLALLAILLELPAPELEIPEVDDGEVGRWLRRAEDECFAFPEWIYDRHTREGRRLGRGYEHFFEEGAKITDASAVLGLEWEEQVRQRALALYLEEEARFGARASSAWIRERWRQEARERGRKERAA